MLILEQFRYVVMTKDRKYILTINGRHKDLSLINSKLKQRVMIYSSKAIAGNFAKRTWMSAKDNPLEVVRARFVLEEILEN